MKALIDGDILLYSCGFAAQKNIHRIFIKGEEEYGYIASFNYKKEVKEYMELHGLEMLDVLIETTIEVEPLENCLHSVKQSIRAILEETQSENYRLFLTGKDNFREKLATIAEYKGNRDKDHKPIHYEEIKKYLINVWNAEVVDGQEADDMLGIVQMENYFPIIPHLNHESECDSIIASVDKDLDMIPGWHYNFRKGEKYWISEDQAIKHFYTQLLTGDSVDNIVGIPGVGPKKAESFLSECTTEEDMYAACFALYAEANPGKDFFAILKENANLLWIRRKEGEEWQPPSQKMS